MQTLLPTLTHLCQLTNLLQLIRLFAPSQNIVQSAATVHTTKKRDAKRGNQSSAVNCLAGHLECWYCIDIGIV